MSGRREELRLWTAERRSRLAVRIARRSFKKQPNRIDRLATRIVTASARVETSDEMPSDLDHAAPLTDGPRGPVTTCGPSLGFFFERDGAFVPTRACFGPWGHETLHGGPVAALLAHVLEAASEQATDSVRLSVEILRPVANAPISANLCRLRNGNTLQVLRGELLQDSTVVAHATLVRLRPSRVDPPAGMLAGDAPPPDSPADWPEFDLQHRKTGAFIVGEGVAMRVRDPQVTTGAREAWMRLAVPVLYGVETSPLQRIAVVADFGNGLSAPSGTIWPPPISYMSVDLDVRIRRPSDATWLRVSSDSIWTRTGYGHTTTEVADVHGVVASAQQTLVLRSTNHARAGTSTRRDATHATSRGVQ